MDLLDPKVGQLLKDEKIEVINHHAAQISVVVSVKDPLEDANINIMGSIKLLQAALDAGVKKFIFASTGGAIYGFQDTFPADENHACRPESPYAISKFSVENYLNYYHKIYGLNTTILRYSNVYGPRQDPHGEAGVVAIFCQKLLKPTQPIILEMGNKPGTLFPSVMWRKPMSWPSTTLYPEFIISAPGKKPRSINCISTLRRWQNPIQPRNTIRRAKGNCNAV